MKNEERKIKAVLSTTVLPLDGVYRIETVKEYPNIENVPHFIGHPDTKSIVESLGAVQSETKLFEGLQPGEKAVCFPIAQGKSSRKEDGFSNPHQNIDISDLTIRVITRIDSGSCPYCGSTTYQDKWHCPGCGAS